MRYREQGPGRENGSKSLGEGSSEEMTSKLRPAGGETSAWEGVGDRKTDLSGWDCTPTALAWGGVAKDGNPEAEAA